MGKTQEEKDAIKAAKAAAKAAEKIAVTKFKMKTADGKSLTVNVPDDDLDKRTENVLGGTFRRG